MPRLTWNDKLTIEKMLKQGCKAPAIARYIGVSDQAIDWINNYPRLLLDWHASNDLFSVFLASVA